MALAQEGIVYAVGRGDVVTQAVGAGLHHKLQVASTELHNGVFSPLRCSLAFI